MPFRRRLIPFLLGAVAMLAGVLGGPAWMHAEVLDRIVAVVNRDVITLGELRKATEFNAAVQGVRGEQNHLQADTLGGLINRRLLLQEARRLGFLEATPQEIRAEMDGLRKRLGSEQALHALLTRIDMTEEELGGLLGERLTVERFLQKKVLLFIRVSREDAKAYFEEHRADFQGRSFQEAYREIIARLSGQKADQQIAQYLLDLRSRADIRMNPL